jgi:hypothetical protein
MNFIIQEVEDHVDEHAHGNFSLESLAEVVFGTEHIIAEFFWNAVFILGTYLFTKAVALRKIHKYVDDKHGVTHKDGGY